MSGLAFDIRIDPFDWSVALPASLGPSANIVARRSKQSSSNSLWLDNGK